MTTVVDQHNDIVYFEAVVRSGSGASMFDQHSVVEVGDLDALSPPVGRTTEAAAELQRLGFRIRHVGRFSLSAEGPRSLWEETFHTRVEVRSQPLVTTPEGTSVTGAQATYLSHVPDTEFVLPEPVAPLIERAYPQPPPIFFASPLPPRVTYHHLRVPADVGMVLRAPSVHEQGVTGRGVLVAMTDTGFYRHPFYAWHDYSYVPTLAPDATHVEHDEVGHGTAEAANIFACARDIDFVGVKMGGNATLAFKAAVDLHPAVITNSWGYHLPGETTLPNFLRPLEAAVIEAVRERRITVCFSGGNGHVAFPAMMPEVIAVGGVYVDERVNGTDFALEASDYASSFDSTIYPGRHVPDVCGLVGVQPRAVYIALPVEPGDAIDTDLAGSGSFPNGDETAPDDGWAVISGTSAASPQVAGVCALLKQVQPGLPPELVKAVLRASARDVRHGKSRMGEPAGNGHDGATGAGLVDAFAAYQLARSVRLDTE